MGPRKASKGPNGKVKSAMKRPVTKKKSKLVITFDPEKRKEYLTGFSRRKQERRRFGLDMEAYKQKKRQLEERKQRRQEEKAMIDSLNLPKEESESESEQESDTQDDNKQVVQFNDDYTKDKFGDVVTVTTSVGGLASDSESEMSEEEEHLEEPAPTKEQEPSMTLFQRIRYQRRGQALPSKRSKLKSARANRQASGGHAYTSKKIRANKREYGDDDTSAKKGKKGKQKPNGKRR